MAICCIDTAEKYNTPAEIFNLQIVALDTCFANSFNLLILVSTGRGTYTALPRQKKVMTIFFKIHFLI